MTVSPSGARGTMASVPDFRAAVRHLPALPRPLVFLRSLTVAVAVWAVVALWVDKPFVLPTPLQVGEAFIHLLTSGALVRESLISLRRLLVAYVLAAIIGVTIGFAMARWRVADHGLSPLVNGFRSLSGIAWIPIGIYWFGVGETLPIFIIFYGAVFPFILNAQLGVRSLKPGWIDAARTLGASERRIVMRVILPATVPYLLAGARIALGLAWMSIIAAELLGSPSGVGFSIQYARSLQQTATMLAWIFWVGALGYALDAAMNLVVARLAPWASAGRGRTKPQ